MKTRSGIISLATALAVTLVMIAASTASALAAAPVIKETEYKGRNTVEVEFRTDVDYRNVRVIAKDTSGTSYAVRIIEKDDDELTFKVKGLKAGKTYRYTVKGVRREYTGTYGSVSGKFTVPARSVSKAAARNTAINDAAAKYKITRSTVRKVEIESDSWRGQPVWEIEFEARKANGVLYELDYRVDKSTGRILRSKCEPED